jgi:hypothetical protein
MAKDKSGRPIPAYIPKPASPDPVTSASQEQFMLAARKVDDTLRQTTDLAQRVAALEIDTGEAFNAALADFEQRFNAMMFAAISDFTKQFEMLSKQVSSQIAGHTHDDEP